MNALEPAVAAHMKRLRELSGSVQSNDAVICFLYLLARDHLPTGVIEQLLIDAKSATADHDGALYTNGYLAQYAAYVAQQLSTPAGVKVDVNTEATSKVLQEDAIIEINGKKYKRVSDAVFREFTGYDDYQISHPETRPRKFFWSRKPVDRGEPTKELFDWLGRKLTSAETKEDVFADFGRPVKVGDGPQAVWYPDGKVFYFDDHLYEPVE
jgi:hypothetical protein